MNRHFHRISFAVLLSVGVTVVAQDTRPMKIVVPFAAGGGGDTLARALVPYLSKDLDRPVLVENKPGANGQIAMQLVRRASNDGTTVILATDSAISIVPLTVKSPGYDSFNDFVPLGQVTRYPYALITPVDSKILDVPALVAVFKKDSKLANIGLPGSGGLPEKITKEVGKRAGVEVSGVVYAGATPMIPFILGGQLSAGVVALNNALPLLKSKKVNIVAVTGPKRSPLVPDVPTFTEIEYPGFEAVSAQNFLAPAGAPKSFQISFNKALNAALSDPALKQKIESLSMEIAPTDLEGAERELKKNHAVWAEVLRD